MLLVRRCIAGEKGHFARTLKTICILLRDSVRYYCKIDSMRVQFRYNDVMKRKIEAGAPGISKKKDTHREKKMQKSECPGGIEPALGGTYTKGAGPLLTGHSIPSR